MCVREIGCWKRKEKEKPWSSDKQGNFECRVFIIKKKKFKKTYISWWWMIEDIRTEKYNIMLITSKLG